MKNHNQFSNSILNKIKTASQNQVNRPQLTCHTIKFYTEYKNELTTIWIKLKS